MSSMEPLNDVSDDVIAYVKACIAGSAPAHVSDDLALRVQKFAASPEAVMDVTIDVLRSGGDVPVDGVDVNGTFIGGRGGGSFSNRLSDYFIRQNYSQEDGVGAGFVAEFIGDRMTAHVFVSDVDGLNDDLDNDLDNAIELGEAYYDPETGYGYTPAPKTEKQPEDDYVPVEILMHVPELKNVYLQSIGVVEGEFKTIAKSKGDLSSVDGRMIKLFVDNIHEVSGLLAEEAGGKLDASEFKDILFEHLQYEYDAYEYGFHDIETHAELLRLNDDGRADLQNPVSSHDLDWDSAEHMFAAARSIEPKQLSTDFDQQASAERDGDMLEPRAGLAIKTPTLS